jgi:hypothetical protein
MQKIVLAKKLIDKLIALYVMGIVPPIENT